jgi:hypothetical protein
MMKSPQGIHLRRVARAKNLVAAWKMRCAELADRLGVAQDWIPSAEFRAGKSRDSQHSKATASASTSRISAAISGSWSSCSSQMSKNHVASFVEERLCGSAAIGLIAILRPG